MLSKSQEQSGLLWRTWGPGILQPGMVCRGELGVLEFWSQAWFALGNTEPWSSVARPSLGSNTSDSSGVFASDYSPVKTHSAMSQIERETGHCVQEPSRTCVANTS